MPERRRPFSTANSTFTILLIIFLLLSVFGIAYASVLIDDLELPPYMAVTTVPQIASDYTKDAASDTYIDRQWGIDDTNLDVVWNAFGSQLKNPDLDEEVYVIVMENVVDTQHEDLQGAFVRLGYDVSSDQDFIGGYVHWSDDESRYVVELVRASDWKEKCHVIGSEYGKILHGSHIAGIVGARHNTAGIAGCSPGVKIIPVLIAITAGETEAFNWILGDLYNLLLLRTGSAPRMIVQRAYEFSSNSDSVDDYDSYAVQQALSNYKRASDAGLLVVHGAGNTARDLRDGLWEDAEGQLVTIMPACAGISADNLLSVAGHDNYRNLNIDSSYSTAGPEDAQAHLSAPGNKIVSLGRPGEYYSSSGTSMAAPHVSGTAALLWQLFPDATAAEIRELILEGAKVSNTQTISPHHGETATTIGGYVRTGFLDAAASVKKSKEVLGEARGLDIEIPVKELVITPTAYGIVEGDTAEIAVTTVLPYTADNKNVTFTSSNPTVASVRTSGGVHTIATGTVTADTEVDIYATAVDSTGTRSNTVTVTVTNAPVPATSIAIKYSGEELEDNETIDITVGETVTLEPVVTPADASVTDADFTWDIDPAVFNTKSGRNITITPSEAGVYTVTVTEGSLGVRCRLNVTEPVPAGISVADVSGKPSGQVSIAEGGTVELRASVTPANASFSPSDIRWSITAGNAALSAVTGETITVTGNAAGTVTVKAVIGSYETSYSLTVTGSSPAPTPSGGSGGGCSTGPATGFTLLIMSIIPMLCRKKK